MVGRFTNSLLSLVLITTAVLLCSCGRMTHAASIVWTGYAHNNQWSSADNWFPAQVPSSQDDVTIHCGFVQAVDPSNVNTLLMGDQTNCTAALTVFNSFSVGQSLLVEGNGEIVLPSGASVLTFLSAPPSAGDANMMIRGTLSFSSGAIVGSATVTGFANMSVASQKQINGTLYLNGTSQFAGVVSLGTKSSRLYLDTAAPPPSASASSAAYKVPSLWGPQLHFMGNSDAAVEVLSPGSSSQPAVEISGSTTVMINLKFTKSNPRVASNSNITIFGDAKFLSSSSWLHLPATSMIITAGGAAATLTVNVAGAGTVSLQGGSSARISAVAPYFGGNISVTGGQMKVRFAGTHFYANKFEALAGTVDASNVHFAANSLIILDAVMIFDSKLAGQVAILKLKSGGGAIRSSNQGGGRDRDSSSSSSTGVVVAVQYLIATCSVAEFSIGAPLSVSKMALFNSVFMGLQSVPLTILAGAKATFTGDIAIRTDAPGLVVDGDASVSNSRTRFGCVRGSGSWNVVNNSNVYGLAGTTFTAGAVAIDKTSTVAGMNSCFFAQSVSTTDFKKKKNAVLRMKIGALSFECPGGVCTGVGTQGCTERSSYVVTYNIETKN